MSKPAAVLLAVLLAAPLAPAGEVPAPGGEKPAQARAELAERIARLVEELGHDDYRKREAATRALLEIGVPALEALRAAAKDKDAERSLRAAELARKIERMAPLKKPGADVTNGYQPVCEGSSQIQTFKVPQSFEAAALRIRVARGYNIPAGLQVELREAGKEKALVTVSQGAEWTGKNGGTSGVTRSFRWIRIEMKAKIEKGRTYKLTFSSAGSGKASPWLINCLYRDAFKDGEHLRSDGEETKKVGKFDLVFELLDAEGKAKLNSVPKGVDLSKSEQFGVGHDGTDLRKLREENEIQGGFL